MQTSSAIEESSAKELGVQRQAMHGYLPGIEIGLLTGCKDRPYVFGLATALGSREVPTDIIGSDDLDSPELHAANLHFLNFRGSQNPKTPFGKKLLDLFVYYATLIRYVAFSSPKILHILWNNKFEH